MRITKQQLKRIIRQEKSRLNESWLGDHRVVPAPAPMPVKSRAHPEFAAALLKEQSTVAQEAELLSDIDRIATSIQEIASGMYGLVDPIGDTPAAGDDMAQDLELQVERLNDFFRRLESYFEMVDDLAGRHPGGSIG